MQHVITREFSITRDFKSVLWGATLWHNLLRAACAGAVIAILTFATGVAKGDTGMLLAAPIIVPFAYLIFYLPLGLICSFLGRFFPFFGTFALILGLFVILGDPIVWILSLVAPRAVPIEKPGFLNPALIMWVLKPDDAVEVTITNTNRSTAL